MSIPKVRDVTSDSSRKSGRQGVVDNPGAGARIKEALGGHEVSWLVRETGYGDTTIRDAIRRGPARSDVALAIAKALKVSLDWLLTGHTSATQRVVADAAAADWVDVPEIDLGNLTDSGKGDVLSSTLFRRDWLNRSFGRSKGLWLTKLPGDYPPLDLHDGDYVVCCDVSREELHERQLCIWRVPVLGKLLVARFTLVHRGNHLVVVEDGEYWINPHLLEDDIVERGGGDLIPIGRILGRPFAAIR